MTSLSLKLKRSIAAEAAKAAPHECCGFVVNGELVPCENVHHDTLHNFAIKAEDYVRAEGIGSIEAVYHSHVDGIRGFSQHDIKSCKQINLPWIVYHLPSSDFFYGDPTGNAPYVGRQWIYGLNDCYALLRDFYKREFNIELDDFHRGDDGEWKNPGWSMFLENYEQQGFREVGRADRKGDMVLMRMFAKQPNHVGVMAGRRNIFYHHLSDRLSEQGVYGGYWEKVTVKVLRHKDV